MWDQGKAEVLIFDSNKVQYDQTRKADVTFIVVKEDHLPGEAVKANDWKQKGLISRFKFNQVITVPTGVYTYRQMLSTFLDRSSMLHAKTVFTSQEWCGQTSKTFLPDEKGLRLDFNSYWEGEGIGHMILPATDDILLYNSLPLVLRVMRLEQKGTTSISMLPDIVSNKVGKPRVVQAKLQFHGEKDELFLVEISWRQDEEQRRDRLWFDTKFPFPLRRWLQYDGSELRRKKKIMEDYWNFNGVKDEGRYTSSKSG